MYFNRKNAEQKNWRMIKKGKHFLFGCSLVFAVGAALVAPSVKADTVEAKPETSSTTEGTKPVATEENPTYAAPAVEVAPAAVAEAKAEKPAATTQNSKEEPVVAVEKAKEADSIQAPEVTVVYDPSALTDEEKAKVVAAVKAVNPTATDVQVQADGSAVVTFADGSRANLTAAQTIKDGSQVAKPRTNRAARATATRTSDGAQNLDYSNKENVQDYVQISYEVDKANNVIHWTVLDNPGRKANSASGYVYFTIPKDSVGAPTNWKVVQTDKNGKVVNTRNYWKDNDGSYLMGQNGRMDSYTGAEMTKRLTTLYKDTKNPAIKGNEAAVAAQTAERSQALYTLTADNNAIRNVMWTITYDTPILDKSKPLDYVAGMQGTGVIGGRTNIMTGYTDNFIDNESSKFQAVAVKEKYTAKVGGSFDADPATYVTNKAGTPEFPNNYRGATTFAWKDGQAPTATTPGTYTKTVVVTYPAHYNQAPQEVTITFEVTEAPEIVNNLAGKASTPATVTVNAPAGSTVKLYNKDGVVIGEAVANDQGVATITPTNSLPEGEVTATSTPAGGTESAKSAPITVTKTPVTGKGGGLSRGSDNTQLLVSASHIIVYPGDKVNVDVIAAATAIEHFWVPQNPTAISGVLPLGAYLTTAGSKTYRQRNASYQGTVAETQPAGDTVVRFAVTSKKNVTVTRDLKVTVLESAKKYEPVAGAKVEVADVNNVSEAEKTKIIAAAKAANTSLPSSATYNVDEKGNLVITYADKSTDKIAAAYLVTPAADTEAPAKPVVNTDLTGKAGTKTPVEVTAEKGSTVALYDKDNNKIGEATAGENGKVTITPTVDIPAGNVTAKATDAAGNTSVASDPATATAPAALVAPTVEIPYSNKDTKEVYVYGGEENSFDIKFKDDSGKIASATVKQGGNKDFGSVAGEADTINTQYGFKANVISTETPATADAPAVITYRGTPAATDGLTQDRLTAATKGENPAGLVLGWRYATATDTDGALIENIATGGSTATDPGAFRVVLKPQNQKYDIATPTEKVTVADPANVTEAELAKIKEKVQLEYSQNNDDANLADKKGTTADKTNKIQSVTKDADGNLVVTYTDGSIDKKPLSEFVNVAPTVEIPYSNKDTKEVYVYGGEENSFDIKFKDDSGKIASATVKQGGNKDFGSVAGEADTINTQYGFKANVISSETPATADAPAVITYRGTPAATDGLTQDRLTAATKGENPAGLVLGWRYATATDTDGALIENKATGGSTATDPGAFRVVLKPQNQKYDIATPSEKVTVADPANVTEAELAKIKEKVQLEYSQNNDDANLADKKGTAVADKDAKIQSVTKDADGNLVVTYTDGSQDKKPLSEFVNVAPTVELPYSNQDKKQIYVYTGENTDLTFKASDNTAVKDMYVRGPGKFKNDNTATYGFTTGKIENSAVTHGDGTVSGATATIKMTGVTNLTAPNRWTSFVVANDNDNAPSNTDFNALDVNPNATQTPGYVQFIVKSQTDKYDIATPAPADKVEVANPDNVTDAEFDKIKEKLQLEYNKNNDDANISKDSPVDKNGKIQSVEKEGNNLVVTYKDGSKDTKPLLDFVTKAPAKPSKPVVDTDLTGKAGTKTPVEVTAEPGSTVALYDKDGHKIGEATADNTGKATITPTVDIPAGPVTVKATKDGQTSDASDPVQATAATPAKPSKPVVDTDLTGKAGTKTPVEVTAEPGSTVALYDKDGHKIGEATADNTGKATITPTVDIPAGPVTVKATKDGQTSDASDPVQATAATPAKPSKPVVDTDLTGKAGTKTPVEVTAEPGSTVALYDKDGHKIGEATADNTGKATITPTVDIPAGPVTVKATKDGQTSDASDPVQATAATPAKPSKPVVDTDLTGKAGTKTPVEVTAEPGSTVALYDKDGHKIGEATADNTGKATITPTVDIPAGPVTVKATKDGQTSDASDPVQATAATPAKPTQPEITTDLTGKAGTKTPVEVTAEPGSKVEMYDKDGNKIGEATADENGKATITPTVDIPEGNVTVVATKDGQTPEASDPVPATVAKNPETPAKPSKPVVDTDLTGKAGTKTPVEVTAELGTKVELFDKDGKKIGEAATGANGKAIIIPTVDIPEGNVTAKATKDGQTSDASDPVQATAATPTTPTQPEITTDLTGKAGTKTPVEVIAEPGSKVEMYDKDGNKIGEATADENGKATITPTVDIPEGNVTVVATKDGQTPEASDPVQATAATPAKPSKPVVDTDLTGKAGTKTPVEVTAEPGSTVALYDKDGHKIGEATADNTGKATITPTVDIPAGPVTVKATKDGQTSDASDPVQATAATPAKPSKPVVDTDLTGKAGTKTPVEVTAEPGSTVALYDKDGHKIGEATADNTGKATITPTVDIPAGPVTVKATKDGQTSDASDPVQATAATPAKPSKPVVDTDLTGKAGTKTPVEVTAELGTKVELFDKDGKKIGEAATGANGKAIIIPTVDIPEGNVTAKATKDGQTSDASDPVQATAATPTTPTQPEITTDLTGKAGTKTPVEVTAEPGSKVEMYDKDGNKIGEATADENGKATITPTVDIPEGNVTVVATKDGQTPEASDPVQATAATPAKPSKPVVDTDLTGKAGTKTPVEVTAEPGSTVALYDKDGHKIGEATADNTGKATITPTVDIPAGPVTVKATKDGQTSDASDPVQATAATPAVTPVVNPSALTDAEKAKVADEVKKANPTATDVKVGEDGTATVTFPDGSTASLTPAQTVKEADKELKDPAVTPVTDPSNLTDAEKAKVADEVKKANPTVTDVKVGEDGTTTVTYPGGTTAVLPSNKTVKRSVDKEIKDPAVTPVTNPSNLTDAEKAKVAEEVKKANPTVTDVKVGEDGITTVTYSDGTTATLTPEKTVKEADSNGVNSPAVTPVVNPSALTDSEKAKVAEEVKKANPTVTDVKVGEDGTATVTYPDGTTAVISPDKTVKKSADKVIKDPAVTPVVNPSALTDAEKAKVADEVKKANPTATDVKVGEDGTATVTYPDGTTAVIPSDKTVKKSDDKVIKIPVVTPVANPLALTDAEKAKVADEVKKANPTATDVKVGEDGTTTVTFPDGSTANLTPAQTVKEADSNGVKTPAVTPVANPSALTDAEKAKVAEEVKKANPTATDVKVGEDGTATVIFPDGSKATLTPAQTVKEADSNGVKTPAVTPVANPSALTDAEKAKVAEEVKKANPTAKDIKVNKDGSVVVTFKDGSTAVIPSDKTVKKSADKAKESDGVKNPSVTAVTDPSNLTDAEKAKVADEVKKANPTAKDIKVNKDGSVIVTFKDGSTAVIPSDKTVKKSADKAKESDGVKNPSVTPVVNPSNLTDAEKAKVADEVKKANPTATDIKVNNDGSVVVTFKDGSTAVIPSDKTVKKSADKAKESDGVKNPLVTAVTDPSNLTDAEKAKVAEEVKKANSTAKDIKVNNDGSVVVTFADGSVAVIPAEKAVTAANQDSPAQAPAKKAGAKELPNTGTKQSSASLALALLTAATGGLLIAKKREEEE
ncbi:Ig-like domain-containing protein [Streptococcus nidrosiense]|uniref:Ig-like domain-containing protein n=2 Tax=Streptococcus TaxID=1301 RepID=UPI0035D088FA